LKAFFGGDILCVSLRAKRKTSHTTDIHVHNTYSNRQRRGNNYEGAMN
jgi:hypothetical protein